MNVLVVSENYIILSLRNTFPMAPRDQLSKYVQRWTLGSICAHEACFEHNGDNAILRLTDDQMNVYMQNLARNEVRTIPSPVKCIARSDLAVGPSLVPICAAEQRISLDRHTSRIYSTLLANE